MKVVADGIWESGGRLVGVYDRLEFLADVPCGVRYVASGMG